MKDIQGKVLLVGHTHQVFCEQLGNTLVINPGSTRFKRTCAILSLPDLLQATVETPQACVLSFQP